MTQATEQVGNEPVEGKLLETKGVKGWCCICMKAHRTMLTAYKYEYMTMLKCVECGGEIRHLFARDEEVFSRPRDGGVHKMSLEFLLNRTEQQHAEQRERYSFEQGTDSSQIGPMWKVPSE